MKYIKQISILIFFGHNAIAQDHSDNFSARSEEIVIAIGMDSIAAFGMLAKGKEKKETVILLHGLPGNERNLDVAQELRRNGRNVIYFNYRGAWGSQGKFLYANCLEDVREVLDFFSTPVNSEKYKVKPNSFVLLGHSMGGGIALISGAEDKRVQKIAVYSPWNAGGDPEFSQEAIIGFTMMLESLFMLNINPHDFIKDLSDNRSMYSVLNHQDQLNGKSLLILDENRRNEAWISHLDNAEYYVWETDHSFSDKRLELIEKISEWIDK